MRYKSVFESSATSLDGAARPVDDFIPRAQIKKSFNEGMLNTAKEITDFSFTFLISEELVKKYVDHLKHLHFSKDLRNQETIEKRRNREAKRCKDYNWEELLLTGGLKSLYV